MRAISLFSGVGGMDMGFEQAGIETVLQAEIDPHARAVLERHWPHVRRVADVRHVATHHPFETCPADCSDDGCNFEPSCVGVAELQECDWIDQGDVRSADGADRIERLGGSTGTGLHSRWGTGTGGGIDLVYGGFPCQDLSTAGKRAGLAGERSGLFFEFARIAKEIRPQWLVIENVAGLLSSNQGRDFGVVLDSLDELGYGLAWRVLDSRYFGVAQPRRRVFIVGCLGDGTRAAKVLDLTTGGAGDPPQDGEEGPGIAGATVPDPARGSYWDGGQLSDTLDVSMLVKQQALPEKRRFPVCITGHIARRLTPRECERLFGWPDDHTRWGADGKEITDGHRYRMIGNGVVTPVARWIGERLVRA